MSWGTPRVAVERAHRRGVRTLSVETADWRAPSAVYRPDRLAAISLAAIRHRAPRGQGFDSFALDIEASSGKPASRRSSRLVTLSRRLRDTAGRRYPLGAIIPSPSA